MLLHTTVGPWRSYFAFLYLSLFNRKTGTSDRTYFSELVVRMKGINICKVLRTVHYVGTQQPLGKY